jgi:acetyltransferase-like isoleucine patch superfamily enzyme
MTTRHVLQVLDRVLRLPRRVRWPVAGALLRARLAAVGPNFVCDPLDSHFLTPATLRVGRNVFFNGGAHVSGDITIGDNVLFGPGVTLLSGNHLFAIKGHSIAQLRMSATNPEDTEEMVIEDEVWVGAHATLLGGIRVGLGAVIGAATVVTRSVPPFVIAAGNPGVAVRRIFADEDLLEHLDFLGYDASRAATVLARRQQAAGVATLPTIDYSERYRAVAPPPRPNRHQPKAAYEAPPEL